MFNGAENLRVNNINAILKDFSNSTSSTSLDKGDEDKYWPIFDYKKNQKIILPIGTAINFFKELCESIQDNFTNSDGEPLYYYGECIGNTRPLRIHFEATLQEGSIEDDDGDGIELTNTVYKIIVSYMAKTLVENFEKTEHGKEYKSACILYSSEQNSDRMDFVIYFPYARLKSNDLRDIFVPRFCSLLDSQLGDQLYCKLSGVTSAKDMISEDTFADTIPLYGNVINEYDYPMDVTEHWCVNSIPKKPEDLLQNDVYKSDIELIHASEHSIFERDYIPKPKSVSQQNFWKPLIFTNSFWKQRLLPINNGEFGNNLISTFNNKKSPYMERVSMKKDNKGSKDTLDKRIILDVIEHIEERKEYQNIPLAKKNAIVKFIKYKMYMTEIQPLIELFAEEESWFKIGTVTEHPPIQVGSDGFYLKFENLEFILDHISGKRCEITSQLEDIACIVYTMARTYEEKEEARHSFIEFVRKNPASFKSRGLESGVSAIFNKQIKRAAKGRLSFWTLLEMFEEDDPLYYNIWWQYICDYYVLHSLDNEMASFPVARAASLPLVGKYLHTTGDAKQTWWKYTGTYWKNAFDTQGIELELTSNFIKKIQCVEKRYGDVSSQFCSKKVNYSVLKDRLNESSFRNGIVKDMANVLLRDNRLLNFSMGNDPEYADFWASMNYVYEFSDGEMKRRKGRWEDFLIKCADVLDELLPLSDPRCQFIMNWVHKMLRDPATEHEFLKELGSFVRGFNRDKRFSVWYGLGNGGKSKFMDVITSTLGLDNGLAFKLPLESMLEGAKRTAGAADPSIEQGRNAFLGVLDEPKKGMKFDAGKIKAATGNDPTYNRGLFSKGGTFRPMYKMVLLGNVLPKADYDMAMKIRFWVWHFRGRFVEPDDAPKTAEEQERLGIYPLDKDLDNKIPEYKAAMLSIMLHYYKLYHKEGVKRTEGIRRATDMFWNSANDVLCFLSEQTVQVKEMDTYINIDELYDAFRRWFMSRNNGERVVTKIVFIDEVQAVYINQDIKAQGGLAGARLRDGN